MSGKAFKAAWAVNHDGKHYEAGDDIPAEVAKAITDANPNTGCVIAAADFDPGTVETVTKIEIARTEDAPGALAKAAADKAAAKAPAAAKTPAAAKPSKKAGK